MKNFLIAILLTCVLGLATRAQDTNKPAAANDERSSVVGRDTTLETAGAASETYKIGPQDVLRVDVWKEPDFTRSVPVRPDGKITLPLLNDVQASGLTPMELAHIVRDGLKKYVTDPQVTVTIEQINSQRIYVNGEVARPGAYPLLPNMTVLQALTSAGGFTQFARIKSSYVLRIEGGKQVKMPFNYKEVINGKKPEDNIKLLPGDTIVVP
jgi:polysaccharide export outer membrane protein